MLSFINQDCSKDVYEIIVVDDGSTDDTKELVQAMQEEGGINLIYVKQDHLGISQACNNGIRYASSRIVAFTEDDCIIPGDWVKKIIYYHGLYPDIPVIQGKIMNFYKDSILACLEQEIWDSHLSRIVRREGSRRFVNEILTGNCSFKIEVFSEFKLDFKKVFLASEEADLALRILEKGEKILFEEDIRVFHKHRQKIFSFAKRVFRDGRGELILSRVWKKNKNIFSSKLFGISFFLFMSGKYVKKYPLHKSLVLIELHIVRKIIKLLGRGYQSAYFFINNFS